MEFAEPRSIDENKTSGYRVHPWLYLREGLQVLLRRPWAIVGLAVLAAALDELLLFVMPSILLFAGGTLSWILMAGIALAVWRQYRHDGSSLQDFVPDGRSVLRLGGVIILQLLAIWLVIMGMLALIVWYAADPGSSVLGSMLGVMLVLGAILALLVALLAVIVGLFYAPLLIVDRHGSVMQSIQSSVVMARRNWSGTCGLVVLILAVEVILWWLAEIVGDSLVATWLSNTFPMIETGEVPFLKALGEPWAIMGEPIAYDPIVLLASILGTGLGTALASCVYAVAYADIFGLPRSRQAE